MKKGKINQFYYYCCCIYL